MRVLAALRAALYACELCAPAPNLCNDTLHKPRTKTPAPQLADELNERGTASRLDGLTTKNLLHLCWLVRVTTTRCWTRRGALIAPTKATRAQTAHIVKSSARSNETRCGFC
eukprot:4618539-Prymnesium_polylepis.1